MKLIKARLRGLDALTESRWFNLNPKLNLFQFPEPRQGRNFLRILQTINPTYSVQTVKPFADFPRYRELNGNTRRVNPAKKTIALAVFAATPGLVKELSAVSDVFYETDRIEVGRRLDYSRWINFVELASSTRWSEISADMAALQDAVRRFTPDMVQPVANLIAGLQPSDRIKGEIKVQLAQWLSKLPPEIQQNFKESIEATRAGIHRVDCFETARDIVRTRMPLFVVVGSSYKSVKLIGPGAIASLDQDSASFRHLLQLVAEKANAIGEKSASEERLFLQELNEQLGAVQPPAMMLRLDKSTSGEFLLKNDKPTPTASDGPLFTLRQMQAKACLAVAISRIAYKTEAILMFDEPAIGFPETLHKDLLDFVMLISKTSQCLYFYSRFDIFPKELVDKLYSAAELAMVAG